MFRYLVLFAVLVAPCAGAVTQNSLPESYFDCFRVKDDIRRLRCYDALAGSRSREALAQSEDDQRDRERRLARLESRSRAEQQGLLVADDPNYFVYAMPIDDRLDDESHVEFYLSLKSAFGETVLERLKDRQAALATDWGDIRSNLIPNRVNVHYNGLYDFYLFHSDRYSSAPVISRRQNPGVSLEWDWSRERNTLRLGWFHESNGQQLESNQAEEFFAQRERFGEDYALAKVSRGWDYAMVRWQRSESAFSEVFPDGTGEDDRWLKYNLEYRLYCNCQAFGVVDGREDEIWWEEGNHSRISDYDGLRGMIEAGWQSRHYPFALNARLELKTNTTGSFAEHWTGKLTLGANFRNLRGTLFYFDGYGREPSTYHLRTRYAGLGIELH